MKFALALAVTLFTTSVFAQDAAPLPAPNMKDQLVMLALIFAIFYFLIIRPQSKKFKEHKLMVEGVDRGDIIVTAGGIEGKVVRLVDEDKAVVQIADGVEVKVVKSTLTTVVEKSGTPKKADTKKSKKK